MQRPLRGKLLSGLHGVRRDPVDVSRLGAASAKLQFSRAGGARVPSAAFTTFREHDFSTKRCWHDPQRLAFRKLTSASSLSLAMVVSGPSAENQLQVVGLRSPPLRVPSFPPKILTLGFPDPLLRHTYRIS